MNFIIRGKKGLESIFLTFWISFYEEEDEGEQNFVMWSDGDEPVADLKACLIRTRKTWAGQHPFCKLGYITTAICRKDQKKEN